MNKTERQNVILRLVSANEVETQEELTVFLNKEGVFATQATVSRDIRELGLIKAPGTVKKFRYERQSVKNAVGAKSAAMFKDAVTDVKIANNIIVIKTHAGNAGAVGSVVDGVENPGILGCVAGDDAVIVVLSNAVEAQKAYKSFRELLR